MQRIRGSLSYSNIVATLALFLALGGGVAYAAATLGKNSVKSGNIAAHAVKSRNLAKNAVKSQSLAASAVTEAKIKKEAVSASKVKKATLTRTNLAAGTLAGLQVAEVTATAVPGLTVEPENGTLVPLAGTATFTPQAGKSYELLTELKGTPTALGGPEAESCFAEVDMFVNGGYRAEASIFSRPNTTGPFYVKPIGSSATAIGLQEVGQPVTLSALSFGSTSCSPATTASLRAVDIELG